MTSPMCFASSVHWVLQREGVRWDQSGNLVSTGYVNDPKDPGGETNFGIAKRWHPNEDIKNMTLARAIEIYRHDYWSKFQCDGLPDAWALFIFDSAVQHPPSVVVGWEQQFNSLCDAVTAREAFYHTIGVGDEAKFLDGWLRRLTLLKQRLDTEYGVQCA